MHRIGEKMFDSYNTLVPTKWIGPIHITGAILEKQAHVPLATFETPLWPSTKRGAMVSQLSPQGIQIFQLDNCMTRSFILQAPSLAKAVQIREEILNNDKIIIDAITSSSKFAKFDNLHCELVGKNMYFRLRITTANAAGHNMTTKAADAIIKCLLQKYPLLQYVSISGNYCTDKKNSAVNALLGRGRNMQAEIIIPEKILTKVLRTTAQRFTELHIKKNMLGSILAGSIRSANSHVANILLATYLATGQDAANIVEGSQAIVHTECQQKDLYFSLSIPNLIVGTVGNGKHHPQIQQTLMQMDCNPADPNSSQKLAAMITATALCGEISCLASQTNQGELTKSHILIERHTSKQGALNA